jgi:hypothetical protein
MIEGVSVMVPTGASVSEYYTPRINFPDGSYEI